MVVVGEVNVGEDFRCLFSGMFGEFFITETMSDPDGVWMSGRRLVTTRFHMSLPAR